MSDFRCGSRYRIIDDNWDCDLNCKKEIFSKNIQNNSPKYLEHCSGEDCHQQYFYNGTDCCVCFLNYCFDCVMESDFGYKIYEDPELGITWVCNSCLLDIKDNT